MCEERTVCMVLKLRTALLFYCCMLHYEFSLLVQQTVIILLSQVPCIIPASNAMFARSDCSYYTLSEVPPVITEQNGRLSEYECSLSEVLS